MVFGFGCVQYLLKLLTNRGHNLLCLCLWLTEIEKFCLEKNVNFLKIHELDKQKNSQTFLFI